jgi:hypothetical protein
MTRHLVNLRVHKIVVLLLLITLFSCDNKQQQTEHLLSEQYDEMQVFYHQEASEIYNAAQGKVADYPYLQRSFDSITKIKAEADSFLMAYPTLSRQDKPVLISKTRKKISSLTKLKLNFIDEVPLKEISEDVFDKGVKADFSKVYYTIVNNYYSQHCNIVQ